MAKPKTKAELLKAGKENFDKLFDLIASMTNEQQVQNFSFEDRDKNIRDVLAHLYEWQQLLINWINSNKSGKPTDFFPKPYDWTTYHDMNIKMREKHQQTTHKQAISMLKESHHETMKIVDLFSDEELFNKKFFSWTGTANLGSYCISTTSSHYDWAIKKIIKHKNSS